MADQLQISDRTKKILENFSRINPSIQFRTGKTLKTMSPHGSVVGSAPIEEEIPSDFAIYDISRLLSVLSLWENPKISMEKNSLVIKTQGRRLQYTYADPSMINSPPVEDFEIPKEIASFKLDATILAEATKVLAILKLPQVVFLADAGKIVLQVVDSKDTTADNYLCQVGTTDKMFKVIFDASKLSCLMPGDYNVTVGHGKIALSPNENVGLTTFKGSDVSYVIAPEDESSYGE